MIQACPPVLQLTWAGFEAAVDLIAAQCRWRDRAGLYGADAAGQLLCYELSKRLGLNILPRPVRAWLRFMAWRSSRQRAAGRGLRLMCGPGLMRPRRSQCSR